MNDMAEWASEFVRRIARITEHSLARFDPVFCGKVVRVAAAVSAIEFLLTVALTMLWVPANSPCHWQMPGPLYLLLFLSGAPALWLCIIAIFWKYVAVWTSEFENMYPEWLRYPKWLSPASTALLTVAFAFFAASVAIPFVMILQKC
jgi:hypothetical protein